MARTRTRQLKTAVTAVLAMAVLSFGVPAATNAQTSARQVSPTFHGPQANTWTQNHYDPRYRFTCRTRRSEDQTWALWTWNNVRSGDSSIEVYIPPEEATANVAYVVALPGQRIRVPVTQADHRGRWVTVHSGPHKAGRIELRLGDANTSASGNNNWCRWGGHHSIGAADARLTTESGAERRNLVWVSSGDSYSSGTEGTPDCRRTTTSYGPTAHRILSRDRAWNIPYYRFEACFGAVAGVYGEEDGFWDSDTTQYDDIDDDREWSVYHDEVDILVVTFGGNDIGFSDVLKGCALVGCLVTEDELRNRIQELGETMAGFYTRLVRDRLSERGRLYVVGYPSLVAPVSEWPFASFIVGCDRLSRRDGAMLARMARELDDALKQAVEDANSQVAGTRVHYLDTLRLYRTGELNGNDYDGEAHGKHELCGTRPENDELRATHQWMNGLVTKGLWVTLFSQSFHPNEHGHSATAEALADLIADTF